MERPEGVPAAAKYDKTAGYWYDGNAKSPVQRLWTTGGNLMLEAPRRNGKLHGELKWSPAIDNQKQYASRVAIAKELGLAGGPTDTQIATYKDGTLVSVRFRPGLGDWYHDELVATLEDGKLAKLEWTIAGIGDGDLFSLGSTVIRDDDFKLPKPWPHKLVATFVNGKLASHAFFNEKGKPVAGDRPLAEWGANTKPAKLRGYVERGDFVADAKKFFPKMEKLAAKLPKKLDKLAQLPAAKAIEAALRKKQLPEMGIVARHVGLRPRLQTARARRPRRSRVRRRRLRWLGRHVPPRYQNREGAHLPARGEQARQEGVRLARHVRVRCAARRNCDARHDPQGRAQEDVQGARHRRGACQ
ncbi:hypothetical protein [Nannocystis pusilla]|uniref:hypothetical protein n=1 Tax=Nannocystis pusilla TaxID=889268 RepID=UPI003B75F5E6